MAIMQFHSLVVLLVLLLCGAGGSSTPQPAPLTQDDLCVGISTSNGELACLVNAALACLVQNAITDEVTFTPCFITVVLKEKCLAKDKGEPNNKDHCIGINVDIDNEQLSCLGDYAWTCYNSFTGHIPPVFTACFQGSVFKCTRH
ncbi:uncharacterized protein LOC123451012 [Hordeum vulgare subsp. vulgare]|uniref:Uncharacterized protein n=1 Tax=Hordeum vulgare subsp. vulgare TaxID=112509 RepID=A0A8I6XW58_HORVV|nr:uncharacterized protein LOC123451012 [Hordeum vulgare subsp. vulgare]KAI4998615.1 hypothetical protein ZWY2020_053957 [Hordeum vulgare]